MPDAVIFDFDGVVVDTEPLHWRAFQRVLTPCGFSFSWEEYLAHFVGLDDRGAFKAAFEFFRVPLQDGRLAELVSLKAAVFQEEIAHGVVAYPGVLELLEEVSATLPVALCSGALRSDILPILHRLGIEELFPVLVSADDVRVSKPDPESYRLAFRRLSSLFPERALRPWASVAIEDTPAGIASARGAGLTVLAVTNNFPAALLGEATCTADSLENLTLADLGRMIRAVDGAGGEES